MCAIDAMHAAMAPAAQMSASFESCLLQQQQPIRYIGNIGHVHDHLPKKNM
jgi:hypothetical protein